MSGSTLGDLIGYKLQRAGITQRTPLKEGQRTGQKRNPVARTHGFRKFVNTTMKRCKVDSDIRKKLQGRSIGMDEHYLRLHQDEFLQEYLKAVDDLTINEENRLKLENQKLAVDKSEIDQLKDQVAEFKAFKTSLNKSAHGLGNNNVEAEIDMLKRNYREIHKLLLNQAKKGLLSFDEKEKIGLAQ
jgi:hypothetical protein